MQVNQADRKPIALVGAGGAIANSMLPLLLKNQEKLRLISRTPKPYNGVEVVQADATKSKELTKALKDCKIAIILIGLEYHSSIWEKQWPHIMDNCITACINNNIPMIFFDNVYMYGLVEGEMIESTPFNPCSRKGEIRANIASYLLQQIKKNNIRASIARSADFYGPHSKNSSMLYQLVFKNLLVSKNAQWLVNSHVQHAFSYTTDLAQGLYMLSQDLTTLGQTWHLPTCSTPLTGHQIIEEAARYLSVNNNYFVLSRWMVKSYGWFNPTIKELYEMLYQYEQPYLFSSKKFENYFNYNPVSYTQGIHETLEFLKRGS